MWAIICATEPLCWPTAEYSVKTVVYLKEWLWALSSDYQTFSPRTHILELESVGIHQFQSAKRLGLLPLLKNNNNNNTRAFLKHKSRTRGIDSKPRMSSLCASRSRAKSVTKEQHEIKEDLLSFPVPSSRGEWKYICHSLCNITKGLILWDSLWVVSQWLH